MGTVGLWAALTLAMAAPAYASELVTFHLQTLSLPPAPASKGQLQWRGSGFYVSDQGAVLTAAHVLAACARPILVKDGMQIDVSRIQIEQDLDLAVMETSRIRGVAAVFAERPPSSPSVYVASFTDLAETPPRSPVLSNAMILPEASIPTPKRGQFAMQARVQPGASGSAVMDDAGRVIGMVQSRSTPEGSGRQAYASGAFAAGLDSITPLLAAAHIPFRRSGAAQLEPDQSRRDRMASFTLGIYCRQ